MARGRAALGPAPALLPADSAVASPSFLAELERFRALVRALHDACLAALLRELAFELYRRGLSRWESVEGAACDLIDHLAAPMRAELEAWQLGRLTRPRRPLSPARQRIYDPARLAALRARRRRRAAEGEDR